MSKEGFVIGRVAWENICEVERVKLPEKFEIDLANSVLKEAKMLDSTPSTDTQQKLKSFVERIERLEEEKKVLSSDITDIYNIAKSDGFDSKALRAVIRLRRKNKEERTDELNAIDTYLHALGDAD